MNKTGLLRRAPARVTGPAREHVHLVSRLLVAQAGAAAAVSLLFSRRTTSVVVTTLMLVAALCVLAALARTGTHAARTMVLSFEIVLIVFGLYRFVFERYVGGTVFAIVIATAMYHPAVVRAYGGVPAAAAGPSDVARGEGGVGRVGPGPSPIPDAAGGVLGESTGR
ncbi:MAG TPA: hypothetical protein VLW50_22775 [Streptosporangiaceae bacterium]|nr:hypothetical protein [Streptosporangiaceae bacterium]